MTEETKAGSAMGYADIWQRYSRLLSEGRGQSDVDGSGGPIYTLVCRLPAGVAEAALAALAETSADWSPHYTYSPSEVHITILFISPYLDLAPRMDTTEEEQRVLNACGAIGSVLEDHLPLRFRAHGLNLFATTVFLQLIQSRASELSHLRRMLARVLGSRANEKSSVEDYEAGLAWDLAFSNLVRFRQPAAPEIVSAVSQLRDRDFGSIVVREVELVRTDKFLSTANTHTLYRFTLEGA